MSDTPVPREYQCGCCGGHFISNWTEAEATAECQAIFGHTPAQLECATVCDPCYKEFMAWQLQQAPGSN